MSDAARVTESEPTAFAGADSFAFRGRVPWPVWAMYRAVRVVAVAASFAGFWGGGVVLAWFVLPFVGLRARDRFERVRRCQRIVSWAFRTFHGYLRALRLVDARVLPLPPRESQVAPKLGGGRVLVANHPTLVDMTSILATCPNICCVAKPSIAASPFIGRLLRLCGFIPAGRDLLERGAALDEAQSWLARGFDVLVFPEGTRSPSGGMHPFQRGAFEIAMRSGAALVPLLVTCNPSALTKGRPFWLHPDRCAVLTVETKPPIRIESHANSRTLRAEVESMYREWLGLGPSL